MSSPNSPLFRSPGKPTALPAGGPANGRHRYFHETLEPTGRCHGCDKPLTGRQKLWCEPNGECCRKYWAEHSWNMTRSYVLKRDKHTCLKCHKKGGRLEVDHILPIVEGGQEFDLNNLRTLCHDCHAQETAALARRQAERKRIPRLVAKQKARYVVPWPGLEA